MSYGSDYLREAMTLNERNGNNKKRLIEKINHENDEINDLLRKASDTSYKLTDDERQILKDNGYTIIYGGGSGKDGGVVTLDGKSGIGRSNVPIDDKVDWHNKFKVNSEGKRNNISPSYKSTNKSSGREKLPQRYTQQAYDMSKDVEDFKSAKSQFIDYDTQVQTEKNRLRKAKLGASSNAKDYYKDKLNYAISGRDKNKKRKDAILNKHGVQARESIEDKQHPLKEDFTEELRSDIQYEIHYSIKDALDNILVNLIDDINREFPEYNLNLNRIDTEQYAVELSEIIMKDLFPNM